MPFFPQQGISFHDNLTQNLVPEAVQEWKHDRMGEKREDWDSNSQQLSWFNSS